ncbi:MAG: protein kinase domain-containing protein [Thermodesulfobacteriota bacterium]
MKVTLKVTKGPEKGKVFEFDRPDTFLVGRAKDCHFRLSSSDPYISRRHFFLEICPPKCVLKDLDSTNPPKINGKIVSEQELHNGDTVEVGYTILQISISQEIKTAKCKKCGNAIPLAGDDIAPDLCGECISKEIIHGQKMKTLCKCGKDLTDKANSDGKAAELLGQVEYVCEECLKTDWNRDLSVAHVQTVKDYILVKDLGIGGMGRVDIVYHHPTNRLLALKKMKNLSDMLLTKRFERECRFTRELIHENLVRYIDSGVNGKEPYLVMQYITGGNLNDILMARNEPLNSREAIEYIIDVLSGLEFMHKHKIIHRDIKPENIVLMKTDSVKLIPKITDFGLAKKYAESGGTVLTQRGTALGTPIYMPPEQVRDARNAREPADLYSVGITLYYLLTGKYPYKFPTPFELKQLQQRLVTGRSLGELLKGMLRAKEVKQAMNIVLTEEPVPIQEKNPDIPKRLADVVDRSIKKDIGRRYQSAAEFRKQLFDVSKAL